MGGTGNGGTGDAGTGNGGTGNRGVRDTGVGREGGGGQCWSRFGGARTRGFPTSPPFCVCPPPPEEAPSTASTTPDSTEGGPEEPEFPPELPAAPEPPEEEEEDEDGGTPPRTPPRELTFSYIAFGAGGSAPQTEPGPRCRRDPRRGRPPRLGSGPPPRGLDPHLGVRAPQKRPGEPPAPPEGRLEGGGALPVGGGAEMEEPPMRPAAPPHPTGGVPQPPPPAPPPDPPPTPDPPPAPPDQSASPAGADVLVWELLLWRDPARSALALLSLLGALCCLARFSAVSVGAHGALAVLAVTLPRRLHRAALRALRPPPAPRGPVRTSVEAAVGLSPEEQQRWARRLARHLSAASRTLARLFLVHSVPESLKFAFLFYLLTYVGAVCNGLTLLGAGVICAFTFPVLYRHHQAQIDQYVTLVRSHLSHLRARIQAKLPSAKAKPQ
ncbi:LOW QUALITY PROTEIN: uncharacterized protein ACIB01_018988 [Guaruba guarouba]